MAAGVEARADVVLSAADALLGETGGEVRDAGTEEDGEGEEGEDSFFVGPAGCTGALAVGRRGDLRSPAGSHG